MSSTQTCAHPAWSCAPETGKKYGSDACADAEDMPELTCQCRHAACQGEGLKP